MTDEATGQHYAHLAIDPLTYAHRNKLGPYEATAIKYLTRWRFKNGLQDLLKARNVIDRLIKEEFPDSPSLNSGNSSL